MSESLEQFRDRVLVAYQAVDLAPVEQFIDLLIKVRGEGRTIFTAGNGGSAATSSHFATDLSKGASYQKPTRFRVIALADSISTITAYANDVSFESIFAEQLTNLAKSGDVLVTISGSGNSPNILAAQAKAKELDLINVAMTGFAGGESGKLADIHINVPSDHMGRIEDLHMSLCHMIAFHFMDNEQHHIS